MVVPNRQSRTSLISSNAFIRTTRSFTSRKCTSASYLNLSPLCVPNSSGRHLTSITFRELLDKRGIAWHHALEALGTTVFPGLQPIQAIIPPRDRPGLVLGRFRGRFAQLSLVSGAGRRQQRNRLDRRRLDRFGALRSGLPGVRVGVRRLRCHRKDGARCVGAIRLRCQRHQRYPAVSGTAVTTQPDQRLNPEEREVIDALERSCGRPLIRKKLICRWSRPGIWARSPTTWCRSKRGVA